ncbi:MAG TPA: NAD(P)/FAD-dependent oxidoreductase [Nevskiaceae bacterium]|nr:NAD(P)/FAD-dependent oxidoreductase [Nevskiaceae bacterium]
MGENHYDVLIIGAGVSGIGMACHLVREAPQKRFAILERREAIGGTWDLFRYPGIRSDSDMMTFGYRFRPWTDARTLADGPSIRQYVTDTAREYGVDRHIRFGTKIERADWSSAKRCWTVVAVEEKTGTAHTFTCGFLVTATGYYNHDQGYLPQFPGAEDFKGQLVHPQHWPEGLNYKGKRVVVIGSGATAVTLIPSMANDTAHITMLQRSPSYVYTVPGIDKVASALEGWLPARWTYAITRARNLHTHRTTFKLARRFPKLIRRYLLSSVRKQVGRDFDMTHFEPRYMPWDERLCAVPNGDLFKVLREGKASIVTDHIERFTEKGILLKSGKTLEADIIVSATGLQLQTLGGMALTVDGRAVSVGNRMTYKGVLVQDVPNLAYLFGYTNLSWTMKIDIAAEYVCRLLNAMDRRGADVVTPQAPEGEMQDESIFGSLQAGYVQRSGAYLPRQGRSGPWRVQHHYEQDRAMYRQPVDDAALQWARAA